MESTGDIQKTLTAKEASMLHKQQLAQYVAQQPPASQALHKWMKALENASLLIPAVLFVLALYLSFAWQNLPWNLTTSAIPTAWFAFVGSFCITILLFGLHAVLLQAFPPVEGMTYSTVRAYNPLKTPTRQTKFYTGRQALNRGWGIVVAAVLGCAFWGVFAWAAWNENWAILTPMITVLAYILGISIAVSIIYSIVRSIFRAITRPQ